jgi:HAD superfamily hydrolase (TIGR01509 family)
MFDLGGVLVDTAGLEALRSMLGGATPDGARDGTLDDQAIRDRWLRSPAVRSFELGRIPPGVFAQRFVEEWGVPLEPAAFLEDLSSWIRRPYEGAAELITRLREAHHVSCFSNCNELHWAKLAPFVDRFDSAFSSHLLGQIKPDEQAFRAVMRELGVRPGQVRFFDDSRANVEAAERLGIRSFLVDGLDGTRRALMDEGVL